MSKASYHKWMVPEHYNGARSRKATARAAHARHSLFSSKSRYGKVKWCLCNYMACDILLEFWRHHQFIIKIMIGNTIHTSLWSDILCISFNGVFLSGDMVKQIVDGERRRSILLRYTMRLFRDVLNENKLRFTNIIYN